jgi:hypothetical protein
MAAAFFLLMGPVFLLGTVAVTRGKLLGRAPRTPLVAPG